MGHVDWSAIREGASGKHSSFLINSWMPHTHTKLTPFLLSLTLLPPIINIHLSPHFTPVLQLRYFSVLSHNMAKAEPCWCWIQEIRRELQSACQLQAHETYCIRPTQYSRFRIFKSNQQWDCDYMWRNGGYLGSVSPCYSVIESVSTRGYEIVTEINVKIYKTTSQKFSHLIARMRLFVIM